LRHRLLLGTHAGAADTNYLTVASLLLPSEDAECDPRKYDDESGGRYLRMGGGDGWPPRVPCAVLVLDALLCSAMLCYGRLWSPLLCSTLQCWAVLYPAQVCEWGGIVCPESPWCACVVGVPDARVRARVPRACNVTCAVCGGFGAIDSKIQVDVRMAHEGGEVNRCACCGRAP
jgi:hypothetical protein